MEYLLERLEPQAAVAVLRLRSLGDAVLTTPALALLKAHRPDLRVGVVVEDRFRAVFEDNPDVDTILPPTVAALRAFAPTLCLNLHGGTRSLVLTLLSGARYRAGFGHFRYAFAYHVRIPRAQAILGVERKVHTAEHLAAAMFYLGVPRQEIPRARLAAPPPPNTPPYALLHPLASSPEKMWPAERFAALARRLQDSWGLEPVFLAGPGEDLSAFSRWRTLTVPLAETRRWIAGATLFIGNDSGPAHMAAAFDVPAVVLFAASDPVVWAPWKAHAEPLIAARGMAALTLERVLEAVERLRVKA